MAIGAAETAIAFSLEIGKCRPGLPCSGVDQISARSATTQRPCSAPRATSQNPKNTKPLRGEGALERTLGTRSLKQSDRYWSLDGNRLSQRFDALYFMQGLRRKIGFATVRACP